MPPSTSPDPLDSPPNLIGLDPARFAGLVAAHGGTSGQATNLMRGLHAGRARRVQDVPDVNRGLLERLESACVVRPLEVEQVLRSDDSPGTRKLVLRTTDDALIETVVFTALGRTHRVTLCLSTQVGCRLACSFCATGHMGYTRNLGADEIIGQVWAALDHLEADEILTGIVFMGMGEPLDNEAAVITAIEILHDYRGFGLAYDKIAVSTTGILPPLARLRERYPRLSVAISLHAVDPDLRSRLVPINRKYPLPELIELLRRYPPKAGKKYAIEYCLIDGVNDSEDQARDLVAALEGIPNLIQAIPLNAFPGLAMKPPSPERIAAFARAVRDAGGACQVRDSRGPDILAACGQLGATLSS